MAIDLAQRIDAVAAATSIGPVLRANADRADREARLPKESLAAVREAGLFRLWVPERLGGYAVDPVTFAETQEELARHDSAAAWTLQVTGSSSWWCSRLPEEAVAEIYKGGPDQIISVAFNPPVGAKAVRGGYRLSGQRAFASNVSDASWTWVTATVVKNGAAESVDGSPVTRAVFFPTTEARIAPTWDTMGMRGTDSADVVVDDVFVPAHRSFRIGIDHAPGPAYDSPLYRIPAMAQVGSYVPPVALGIARDAIDELVAMVQGKTPFASTTSLAQRATAQGYVGRAEAMVRSARCYLHDRLASCWEQTKAGADFTMDDRAELLLAAVNAVEAAVQAVDLVARAAGTTGVYRRSRIEQHYRDIAVVRQHGFVSAGRFETFGQVRFGLPPDLGFVGL